jgi:hypothetical protein
MATSSFPMSDRLAQAKSRPRLIERAIATALHDAVAWRIGGGSAPTGRAFETAAVAAARLTLDAACCDPADRSPALADVQNLARRFAASALYRRVMTVPTAQFLRLPPVSGGPVVVVRDRRRRLHAIALTIRRDAIETIGIASRLARVTPLASTDRLTPLTVHVFSLSSGQRHMFVRDVSSGGDARFDSRVA